MAIDPVPSQHDQPIRDPGMTPEQMLFKRLTVMFGILTAATGITGLLTARFGIVLIGTANNRMIAFSAALIWIFLGAVLAYNAARQVKRAAGLAVQAVLALIAVTGFIEFIFSVQGSHFIVENFFVSAGTVVLGNLSSPVSPAALALAVPASLILLFEIRTDEAATKHLRLHDITGIAGLAIVLVSFTFVLSYAYGNPLLYGTGIIPIAFVSALAAFFTGAALIASAGPGALPVRYMTGNSTTARLLRAFIPLVIGLALIENFVIVGVSDWFNVRDAVILSATLVVFAATTVFVVARVSGNLGSALERAEKELVRKNEDLGAMNEELTAIEEELRQTNDDSLLHERQLVLKNDDLNVLNEELTATHEELRQNIDELARSEMTLRESEHRLARSQAISHLGSWELDLVNDRLSWSDEVYRIFGLRPREFDATYEAFLAAIHPDDRSAVDAAYSGSLQEGRDNYEIVHRIVRKDTGEIRYVHEKCEHVRDEKGTIIRSMGMVHDITERRKAEEDLVESQKENTFLADLLNRSEQPFGVGYPDGRLGIVNGAFERLTGYTGDDLRTMDWATTLTPPEWREPEQKSLEQLNRTGLPVRYEKEYLRKDGTRVPIELLVQLVKDSNGNPLHYFSFITDITERKRAKEELERKNEDLNALNEEITATQEELHQNLEELTLREEDLSKALAEKEILLSEIHHRVKNNLTAFISLLSLEGSTEESPAGKALKQDLQNRARSMALIHETLYRTHLYNEVDMGIYLTTLIDQIAASFKTTKTVRTVVEAKGVMLDIPRATPAGLIVNEIVTNSFKYAFPASFDAQAIRNVPPTITIPLAKRDGEFVLTVKDNGAGLPAAFDLAKTQTLGLKLVNFLARHQLRAKIEVSGSNGTEFVFRFKESQK